MKAKVTGALLAAAIALAIPGGGSLARGRCDQWQRERQGHHRDFGGIGNPHDHLQRGGRQRGVPRPRPERGCPTPARRLSRRQPGRPGLSPGHYAPRQHEHRSLVHRQPAQLPVPRDDPAERAHRGRHRAVRPREWHLHRHGQPPGVLPRNPRRVLLARGFHHRTPAVDQSSGTTPPSLWASGWPRASCACW